MIYYLKEISSLSLWNLICTCFILKGLELKKTHCLNPHMLDATEAEDEGIITNKVKHVLEHWRTKAPHSNLPVETKQGIYRLKMNSCKHFYHFWLINSNEWIFKNIWSSVAIIIFNLCIKKIYKKVKNASINRKSALTGSCSHIIILCIVLCCKQCTVILWV